MADLERKPEKMLSKLEVQVAEQALRDFVLDGRQIDSICDISLNERGQRQRVLGRIEALQWVLGQRNAMTDFMTEVFMKAVGEGRRPRDSFIWERIKRLPHY